MMAAEQPIAEENWYEETESVSPGHTDEGSFSAKVAESGKIDRERPALNLVQAAIRIQRAWRCHIDTQVFQYYRDLINFQSEGEPADLLRTVNPAEARHLDAASGTVVRFRLGGEKFPPAIYYKIYTRRPIQDLCANSPKDYTVDSSKLPMAAEKNCKVSSSVEDKILWYKRYENNGWRILTTRVFYNRLSDPVTWRSAIKPVPFVSPVRLVRQQDVQRRKKRRKFEWMRKLYTKGNVDLDLATKEIQLSNNTVKAITDERLKGEESWETIGIDDLELDELLAWSGALNFDDYFESWTQLGTSESTEKIMCDNVVREFFLGDQSDDTLTLTSSKGRPKLSTNTTQYDLSIPRIQTTPASKFTQAI